MLSAKDCRTILSRCGLLFAAVLLTVALLSCVWDTCLTLQSAARLDASAKVGAILQYMADTGSRAALTGDMSALDGMYDRKSFSGMTAYNSEYDRIIKLKRWSGQQSAAITGTRTTVTVSYARRTVSGYTAVADFKSVYMLYGADNIQDKVFELSSHREVELERTADGYIITSDEYLSPSIGRILRK